MDERLQKFTHVKMSTNKIDNKYYNQCQYCKKCKTKEIEDEDRDINIYQQKVVYAKSLCTPESVKKQCITDWTRD